MNLINLLYIVMSYRSRTNWCRTIIFIVFFFFWHETWSLAFAKFDSQGEIFMMVLTWISRDTPCCRRKDRQAEWPASAATWRGVWCCCWVATFKFTPTPCRSIRHSSCGRKAENIKPHLIRPDRSVYGACYRNRYNQASKETGFNVHLGNASIQRLN